MNGIKVSPERFDALLRKGGITRYRLAGMIGSHPYQLWRLRSGKHTTSFRYLARLIPVFGLLPVADIIDDEAQRMAFLSWYREKEHQERLARREKRRRRKGSSK